MLRLLTFEVDLDLNPNSKMMSKPSSLINLISVMNEWMQSLQKNKVQGHGKQIVEERKWRKGKSGREKNGEKEKLNIILDNAQMSKTHIYMNTLCLIWLKLVSCYIIGYKNN